MEGLIFDIQRFSIHDGPGIRTTVFLKGCNLRCLWCHNPESMEEYPEIQEHENLCIKCGECLKVCSNQAVVLTEEAITLNRKLCSNCGKCAQECFTGAKTMVGKYMTVKEILDEVDKDKIFYSNSGGGVTFSGGEPLLQNSFLLELLKESRKRWLHTVVDTAGNIPWENLREIAEYVDLFLYDIKVMDEKLHKKVTGVSNVRILDNLKKLASMGKSEIIIRIPVIPGVNNTEENMEATSEFIKELGGVKSVELLSFHKLGENKYKSLGKSYPAKAFKLLEIGEIESLGEIFSKKGIITNVT